MKIEDLHIGMTVVEKVSQSRESMPMQVIGIFKDGTVYLDFDGNEGDFWEVEAGDLELVELRLVEL